MKDLPMKHQFSVINFGVWPENGKMNYWDCWGRLIETTPDKMYHFFNRNVFNTSLSIKELSDTFFSFVSIHQTIYLSQPVKDYISVDWLYEIYSTEESFFTRVNNLKIAIYNFGRLVYVGDINKMPRYERTLESCLECGEYTDYVCNRCGEPLCENCGASTSPPNLPIEEHICQECLDDHAQNYYGD